MLVGKSLSSNDVVQISAHQMSHQVDLLKRFQILTLRRIDVKQADNIFMIHVLQQAQFTKSSLSMSSGLKGTIQFFDCHLTIVDCVNS